ncbi:AraC family transcriptional regulator [Leptospira perolatii]|uniref:AraC family transcriptional regulator n=1 Tax=Leptospira perolatii TaxID=2023191 RepID=A0A2M9ZQW8_9LEPT|nr:helix-turn-helix domain-containing protein [Leptospira perolatii]PJZ70523.1 AraC family transcriptional regulator [Leptospira perolatii]PJZ74359.1 AraC family transcriptional regulator [Leptospira perolatii]
MDLFGVFRGITFFGACLGLLMCLGQLAIERKTALNRLLATLFLAIGGFEATILLFLSGEFQRFPWLASANLPILGSLGPLLYGIHRIGFDSDSSIGFWGIEKKHFLVPFLFWTAFFSGIFLSSEFLTKTILEFLHPVHGTLGEFAVFVPLGLLLIYVSAILKKSRDLFRWEVLREEKTARILLFLVFATMLNVGLGILFLATKEGIYLLSNSAMVGMSLCLAYLIGHRRPEFFQTLQYLAQATRQKYQRSLLQGIDRSALKENLIQLMISEKLYRDEELSLADLADELALTTHQISELINQELGMNFSAFVNDFRIQEACKLLKEDPARSVLDIAFEVGFGTKSSFHRAFQKNTGKTPTEFRKEFI